MLKVLKGLQLHPTLLSVCTKSCPFHTGFWEGWLAEIPKNLKVCGPECQPCHAKKHCNIPMEPGTSIGAMGILPFPATVAHQEAISCCQSRGYPMFTIFFRKILHLKMEGKEIGDSRTSRMFYRHNMYKLSDIYIYKYMIQLY